MKTTALEGIRVLDLTRVLAGPYATMVLGDLGADIIKVEIPQKGDDARSFGPYINQESAYFLSLNRNKRSITLDLKNEAGKTLFMKLVEKVDILVENFRPGTMQKLGLGYETLSQKNPALIYAAISGFGHTGPYSQRAAYDAIVQAMGGIMSITGQAGGQPTRVGTSIGDITAGLFGVAGILAALHHRHESGKGQFIDVAMLDCQVAILENALARYAVTGEVPQPIGNRHPSIVPFETFETLDGQLMLAAGNDALWKKFCKAIEQDALAEDQRFVTNPLRNEHYDALRPLLSAVMKSKTTQTWLTILEGAGIPCSPINSVDKLFENSQVAARQMIVECDHPAAGTLKMAGVPLKMSETPGSIRMPAPVLGQHSREIVQEILDCSQKEIETWMQAGAFGKK